LQLEVTSEVVPACQPEYEGAPVGFPFPAGK
jgi:hypothetical protein